MKSVLLVIILFALNGCNKNQKPVEEKFNGNILRSLVSQAIEGIYSSNQRLSNMIDYSLPINNSYNSIIVDSITHGNKTYYYVLLEFPDPKYNRFAVYDSSLSPQLIDKSLNGNIYLEKIMAGNKDFIKIDEVYLSKDTLLLNRLSLYQADTSGVYFAFRTHTKFSKSGIDYFQNLMELSDSLIRTSISSMETVINNKEDKFNFDSTARKYISSQNIFDEFIKNEVKNFNYEPVKQQLIDTTTSN